MLTPNIIYLAPMSTSSRDQIRQQREEEDDDMMLFLFSALSLLGSSSGGEKKHLHTFDESGEVKVRRLLQGHEKNCLIHFQMEPRIFKALPSYLRRNM
jgi:transcriptional antiterminator